MAYRERQNSAEAISGGDSGSRRWAAMEMLSMLKIGYTILRSETPATDLVNTFMDWAARRSLLLLAVFLPPYYVYKLTRSAFAVVAPEDVAGKVVLITGASSGIGEVWASSQSSFYTHVPWSRLDFGDFDFTEQNVIMVCNCFGW